MKLSAKTKQNLLYILIALIIVAGCYTFFSVTSAMKKSIQYVYAKTGRITNYEEATAIVVRDEEVLDTKGFSGDMQIVALDASKVAKNDRIVSFVNKGNNELEKKLDEIDNTIQNLIEESTIEYSSDVKSTEKIIENEFYDLLNSKNSIYDINIFKKTLYSNLELKIKQIGDSSSKNSELKELIKERSNVESEINKAKSDLKAPKSGLVSYRVDGYESSFSVDNFSKLSVEKIKGVKFADNQQIPITSDKIKLINNFYSYLVVITKSEESKSIKLNDTLKICLDTNFSDYEKANVDYIIEDGENRIIVLKIFGNSEQLSLFRVVKVYLIWWNYEGIKVQDDCIYDAIIQDKDNKKTYATVKAVKIVGNTGYQKEAWIKVEDSANGFSIISNYSDEELIELGVPSDMVSERNQVNMYDKIIVNKT